MKTGTTMRYLRVAAVGLLTWGAGVSAHADYKSTMLSKNPVGYWRLNETNQPSAGIATNSGTLGAAGNGYYINGVLSNVPGPLAAPGSDTAARFNGFSQKVQVPYTAELNPTNEFSVEAWVKPTCVDGYDTGWYRAAVRSGGAKAGGGYQIQWDAGTSTAPGVFKFTLFTGTSGVELFAPITTPGTTLATNNGPWFHMVGTWSSSDGIAHLYVNGVELFSASRLYTPTTNSVLRIGAGDTDPSDPWGQSFDPGPISQVAVYATNLTPDQIIAHYENGTNPAPSQAYATLVAADGAVGYWRLNETALPALLVATNLGTAGAALNGTYGTTSIPGAAGPQAPNYGGLETNNAAVNIASANGAVVWVPPVNVLKTNELTITAWIKRNGPQLPAAIILGRRVPSGTKAGFCLDGFGYNSVGYNWADAGQEYNFFDRRLTVPDGVWTFVAMVSQSTGTVLYMDSGAGLVSTTNAWAISDKTAYNHECLIGANGPYAGRAFNGLVDEVAVFTNVLTAADIADLRNAAFGSAGLFLASSPATRPVMLGGNAPFKCVVGAGTAQLPISYQLLKDGVPTGPVSSSSTLTYSNIQVADLASSFKIVASATSGSVTSSPAGITRWTIPGSYSEIVESYHPAAYYRFKETSGNTAYEIAQVADATVPYPAASHSSGPQPADWVGFEADNTGYTIGASSFYKTPSIGFIITPTPVIKTNTVTITAWVKPVTSSQNDRGIYFTRRFNNDFNGFAGASDAYAGFGFGNGSANQLDCTWSGHYYVGSGVYAYPNEWNFVAMALTSTDVTFYCYNKTAGWVASTKTMGFTTPNLLAPASVTGLGSDPSSLTGRCLDGQIDEVVVFNQTLAEADIHNIADAGMNVHLAIEKASSTTERVSWSYGTLQWADTVDGLYTDVPGAPTTPFTTNSTTFNQKFFRSYYTP
jgi:hypothetical protein